MERNYLMVRAMHSTENDFKIIFDNDVIAVGWSEINFAEYSLDKIEELINKVNNLYYSSETVHRPTAGKKLNEVRRFHQIKDGDFIIIPYYNSIRLAIAKDDVHYSDAAYDYDLANQRRVNYLFVDNKLKTVPRDALSEAFQRRLRVRGSTVSNLYEFKDEIESLFNKDSYSWTSEHEEKEKQLKNDLKGKLISKIRNGKTNLKTGGIGLEHLVRELFICEGYEAQVLAKTSFESGDADVYAVKSDKFQETKALIQVKHHSGYSNEWGLVQLAEIQKNEKYSDHLFILVTSADISLEIKEKASDLDITIIDGDELAEWIIENLSKLSLEIKIKLGLSSIPQLNE